MYKNCQVCGNPIVSDSSKGTEENGQPSKDFCSNCYHGGRFANSWQDFENTLALAAPYYPGMYGYMGYNWMLD